MGPVTDVPLLDRGSPETEQGPAVANPRIRVCSTVVFSAAPCHARPSAECLLPSRSGDERSCLTYWKRDMRVGWPVWFLMDFQGAAGTEVKALQDRNAYLATKVNEDGCG